MAEKEPRPKQIEEQEMKKEREIRVNVNYGDLGRIEALDTLLDSNINSLEAHTLQSTNSHVEVWVDSERMHSEKPLFKCKVNVRRPRKKEVFIEKSGSDLIKVVDQTFKAVERAVRRDNERIEAARTG